MLVTRGGRSWGAGKISEGDQQVEGSSYKKNKSGACNVEHRELVSTVVITLCGDRRGN